MSEHDAEAQALEEFRRLIDESALGTAAARAVSSRVSRQRAERLAELVAADDNPADTDPMDQHLRDLLSAAEVGKSQSPVLGHQFEVRPPRPRLQGGARTREMVVAIAEIIEEVVGIEPSEVTLETSFVDDLDIDSLSLVEIAVAAEDKYGVNIPDEDFAGLRTVGDVVAYLQKREAAEPEAPTAAVVEFELDARKGEWDA